MNPDHAFANWNIVVEGWYFICPSQTVQKLQVKSFEICGQKIAIFRNEAGKVSALKAHCSHLGTDLALGKVEGDWVRCYFHHWAFDGMGHCQEIPCQKAIPPSAHLPSYAITEKYGLIWVYPAAIAPFDVPEFEELKNKPLFVQLDRPFTRHCHHHICMMNGIDAQHLNTIHHLNVAMELSIAEAHQGRQINFTMRGDISQKSWREKLINIILGQEYEYSMVYDNASMGLLTIMKKVRFFPPLHMIYAYNPVPDIHPYGINPKFSHSKIQCIYITEKRRGILGLLISYLLLLITRLAYYFLRHEDGLIYDNIEFSSRLLLKIDEPLKHYMNYVNQLPISQWSLTQK